MRPPADHRWRRIADALPDFPWDSLAQARATAAAHPEGPVDLSIGTPVDRVPTHIRAALAEASDAPGYPTAHGTDAVRRAYADWLERAHGVPDLDPVNAMPTIGSKELVAALPALLGFGPGDTVVVPEIAYPTYEVGVLAAGATVVKADALMTIGPEQVGMIWLNTPGNPTGKVLPPAHLAKVVAWARARGIVVASDECYLDLGWDANPLSILHPEVSGGDHTGLLAVHSLSKRSNLAGYRVGFVSGDPAIVAALVEARKHLGGMMPAPMQAAAVAALSDDGHVLTQRSRYAARREILSDAFTEAGFRISHEGDSAAGLYLWLTRDEPAEKSAGWLAERGIIVAPGTFYGAGGSRHIRVAFTATDERVKSAAARLSR